MDKISVIKNVAGLPTNYPSLSFGMQIAYRHIVADFISPANPRTKSVHLSQKRQSYKKAIKEFSDLYKPTAFYIPPFNADKKNCFDDSFVVYYQVW